MAYLYDHTCLGEQREDTCARARIQPVSHLVCSGVYDWSTGLIYQNRRYFDPNLGIWLALAPLVVVQGWRKRKDRRYRHLWMLMVGLFVVGSLAGCGKAEAPVCTPMGTPGWGSGTGTPDGGSSGPGPGTGSGSGGPGRGPDARCALEKMPKSVLYWFFIGLGTFWLCISAAPLYRHLAAYSTIRALSRQGIVAHGVIGAIHRPAAHTRKFNAELEYIFTSPADYHRQGRNSIPLMYLTGDPKPGTAIAV